MCWPRPALLFASLVLLTTPSHLRPMLDRHLHLEPLEPDPLKSIDYRDPNSHLSKILIPRAPQTENITTVREYIVSTLEALRWHIDYDEFEDDTPIGRKKFVNFIATKDPEASRRVILTAHYDSKYFAQYPEDQFVGATDSAAPCAFMLDSRAKRLEDGDDSDDEWEDTTLQLVFFDGEEAFHSWTDTDSTYGSRHLAAKWQSEYMPPTTPSDLLGSKEPTLRNYYADTCMRLGEGGHFTYSDPTNKDLVHDMDKDKWVSWFLKRTTTHEWGGIGDDHLPFLQRGVSVLHVISQPFPRVWHTLQDDASALDIPTMRRWNLILRLFFAEYLKLRPEDVETTRSVSREPSEL
ncbi:glutaminyl-peptide cyclotransferase-like protein [Flagelloscypha sp. PMI_526]|nr:glutaminyl-peptide cyclotransferase-like protein [Flagelloscypha sp. PMI_526]